MAAETIDMDRNYVTVTLCIGNLLVYITLTIFCIVFRREKLPLNANNIVIDWLIETHLHRRVCRYIDVKNVQIKIKKR